MTCSQSSRSAVITCGMRDQAAGVELGQDAVEAELLLELLQAVDHPAAACRRSCARAAPRRTRSTASWRRARRGSRSRARCRAWPIRRAGCRSCAAGGGCSRAAPRAPPRRCRRHRPARAGRRSPWPGWPAALPRRAVGLHHRRQLGEVADARGDEDRMAHRAHLLVGVGAGGGDADLGPRLLHRPRREADVVVGEVLALVAEALLGEGALDDRQRLGEALAALAVVDAVGLVGVGEARAADAEDQPAVARDGRRWRPPRRGAADGRAAAPAPPCRSSCSWCARRSRRPGSAARRAPSARD